MSETNPFEEPSTRTSLTGSSGARSYGGSYGGSGGYQPQEVFGDKYVEAEGTHQEYKPELQFQSFQHTSAPAPSKGNTINSGGAIVQPAHTSIDFEEHDGHEPLAGPDEPQTPPSAPAVEPTNAKFWSINFYKFMFNVDTIEVGQRVFRSLTPFRMGFIETAKANPDFYGPFWIATTLVFILAMAGNLYAFFKSHFKSDGAEYITNFQVILVGAGVFYGYVIVIPFVFWGVFKYLNVPVRPLEIICIYGYSLFIYIPVSVVCVIPSDLLQWVLTFVACGWSGFFLISNLMHTVKDFALKRGIVAMMVVAGLHVALALTYKLYFFQLAYK